MERQKMRKVWRNDEVRIEHPMIDPETRLIGPMKRMDCCIVFNEEGIHFYGVSPVDLGKQGEEQFEAAMMENPSLGKFWDSFEWISETIDDGPYEKDTQ